MFKINSILGAVAVIASISPLSTVPAFAVTGEEVINAIDKEHILAPGARLNARVDGGTLKVSTYRHSNANDKDLKIDAVLISKTAMTLDPSITRVVVFFFNTRDLSHYKQTTVSTGDVKAFASGSVGKDELIASLPIEELENTDPNSRVESAMLSGYGYRLSTTLEGNKVSVSTDLDPSASERDLKYVALRIAEKALSAAPKNVSDVKIAFADPSQAGAFKQVSLNTSAMKSIDTSLNAALDAISVTETTGIRKGPGKTIEVPQAGHAIAGPMQEERQKLVDRIIVLTKTKGSKTASYMTDYQAIEKQISENADETTIQESIKQLTEKVDLAEKQK